MKKIVLAVVLVLVMSSCGFEQVLQKRMEYAYMEGQKDLLEGEQIIERMDNGDYRWIANKTPWDSGKNPVYKYSSSYLEDLTN